MKCNRGYRYPCGKCGNCLELKRQEWSYRCQQETLASASSYVVTLTYSPEEMPYIPDHESGELKPTLIKDDLKLFIRRLRQAKERKLHAIPDTPEFNLVKRRRATRIWNLPIRYYGVGEYGSETKRPHYHVILWNVPPSIMEKMEQIWGNYDRKTKTWVSKGLYKTDELSPQAITYCLKYLITKEDHDKTDVIQKPFALMSRNPGIGYQWLFKNAKYRPETIKLPGGAVMPVPRYYKEAMELSISPEDALDQSAESYDKRKNLYAILEQKGFKEPVQEFVNREFYHERKKLSEINKNDKL